MTEASSGSDGLTVFKSENPDLVISDVVMDNGEGVETMRWIHELNPYVPVIAMSAHEIYLVSMKKLGAARTLLKPFRMQVLLEVIDEVLAASPSGL